MERLRAGVDTCTRSHYKLLMGEGNERSIKPLVEEGTIHGLRPEGGLQAITETNLTSE